MRRNERSEWTGSAGRNHRNPHNGSKFTYTTVTRLLKDPTAKGKRRANYTRSTGSKKHWELKPESDWVYSDVEAIVPEQLWNQVNRILGEQERTNQKPPKRARHLFAGLTFCECGQKMYVTWKSNKYVCQKCRNKIAIDDIETIFIEQLKGFFFSPEEVRAHLELADATLKEKEALLAQRQDEHRRVSREMDQVYRLYVDGEITPAGFGERYGPLEERRKQIEDELPRLQAELDFLKIHHLSTEEVISEARDLYGRWTSFSDEEKRRIVESITERLIFSKLARLARSTKELLDFGTGARNARAGGRSQTTVVLCV